MGSLVAPSPIPAYPPPNGGSSLVTRGTERQSREQRRRPPLEEIDPVPSTKVGVGGAAFGKLAVPAPAHTRNG